MATKSPKERAIELDAEGRCVQCGESCEARKRGLCEKDYQRFRRARDAVQEQDREAFEAMLIEEGRLLASRQGRKSNEQDPYAAALDRFLHDKMERETKDTQGEAKSRKRGTNKRG